MHVHGSGGVSVRRRSAAHGCADAHADAAAPGRTVGSIESMSASGEMRGSRVITGLNSGLKCPYLHPFYTCLNPCNVGVRYPVHRDPQIQAYRSIPHDNGLGDHGSTTENSLKISVKRPFMTKIFFACGAPNTCVPTVPGGTNTRVPTKNRVPH